MKIKSLILMTALGLGTSLSGAELTVVSVEKVEIDGAAFHPVLSPDGNTLLFSNEEHKGLKSLNLVTNAVNVIDENAGAGFEPVFSADGKSVVYRTASYQGKLMYRDVRSFSLDTSKAVQLMKPNRDAVNTKAIANHTFAYSRADKQSINVSVKGKTQEINPIKDGHRYVWTSISPSNDKLLFNEIYTGLYVSELDGTKAKHLAMRADFPCWAGDDFVVALSTTDDGYVIKSAKIIAIEIATGKVTELTGDDVIIGGLSACKDKIAYATENGEMYIMNIKIAE